MKSSVLLLTQEYPPQIGGVGRYYKQLVEAMPSGSIQVEVATGKPWQPWWKALPKLVRLLRRKQISHLLVGQILPLGTLVWLASKCTSITYSVFIHGMDMTVPQQYPRKRWLMRHIIQQAKSIITVSHYTQDRIIEFLPTLPKERIHIIAPGPFITPESGVTAATTNQKYILSVGRLVPRKGFDVAIEAFAKIAAEFPDVNYIIAGSGGDALRLQRSIHSHALTNRISIVSANDTVLASLYANCEFFVMPARIENDNDFEGFGIVVLEANSFGKPAIGGNVAGMTDAILPGQTGALIDPNNVEQLADTMGQWLQIPDRVTVLGEQAKRWVDTQQNWSKKAEQLAAIIHEV